MIKFSELNTAKSCEGLVPAIIQDDDTRQVLMLGYLCLLYTSDAAGSPTAAAR